MQHNLVESQSPPGAAAVGIGVTAGTKNTEFDVTLVEPVIVYGEITDFDAEIENLHSHLLQKSAANRKQVGLSPISCDSRRCRVLTSYRDARVDCMVIQPGTQDWRIARAPTQSGSLKLSFSQDRSGRCFV